MKNGLKHGLGKHVYANGDVLNGIWEKGVLKNAYQK